MKILDTLDRHAVGIGRFAWVMAWVGLVGGQLHALARHATEDGKADLDLPTTAFWAEPAAQALKPLLDWGDPDLVYVTYGKIWLPVFVAFFLCALVTYRRRMPVGFEKWAWRVALVAYAGAVVDVFLEYWTQWTGSPTALLDIVFLVGLPFVLLTMVSSTVLGITLLRKGFRPRASAWLLTLTLPGLVVISMFTSLGNISLPIAFAFGIIGRQMANAPEHGLDAPLASSRLLDHRSS
jgi:hypothetical protein